MFLHAFFFFFFKVVLLSLTITMGATTRLKKCKGNLGRCWFLHATHIGLIDRHIAQPRVSEAIYNCRLSFVRFRYALSTLKPLCQCVDKLPARPIRRASGNPHSCYHWALHALIAVDLTQSYSSKTTHLVGSEV